MSKNALGICYESSTIFRIGEFVAKSWTAQILWSEFPNIGKFVAIRGIRALCGKGV